MAIQKEDALNFEQIDSEIVHPLYYNKGLLRPPFQLYRINSPQGRTYFRFQDEVNFLNPVLYMGTGSIVREVPVPKQLENYRAKKGIDESDRYYFLRMLYGSFSHSRLAEFIQFGCLEGGLDKLPERLKQYYFDSKFYITDEEFHSMSVEIKKDMIGIERFIYDTQAEFVFVEYPVTSEIDGCATQIDFGAFMTIKESVPGTKKDGTPKKTNDRIDKRVFGIVNYKSGGIYPIHGMQLLSEYNMFMESYPTFTTTQVKMFSLACKDFKTKEWNDKTKPYQLKDWTDEVNKEEFFHYQELAKIKREKRINTNITTIAGDLRIGTEPSQHIVTKTIKEIIEDGTWRHFEQVSASIPDSLIQP